MWWFEACALRPPTGGSVMDQEPQRLLGNPLWAGTVGTFSMDCSQLVTECGGDLRQASSWEPQMADFGP